VVGIAATAERLSFEELFSLSAHPLREPWSEAFIIYKFLIYASNIRYIQYFR
jgi:hypothetical protein